MNYIHKILIGGLLLFSINLSAQTQSDYTLESSEISVFETNQAFASSLVKTGNTLKWIQNPDGTSNTITYTINSITGDWDAANSQGQLTYSLNKPGATVTFILIGTQSDGLNAILSIQKGSSPVLNYNFNISNITYP